ncbi:MAG: hypothetical protein AAGC93_22670 [Cyanobacteria bacterium P01_F01_bin.53]
MVPPKLLLCGYGSGSADCEESAMTAERSHKRFVYNKNRQQQP